MITSAQKITIRDCDSRTAAFLENDYPVIENSLAKLESEINKATETGKQYVPDVRKAKIKERIGPVVKEFSMTLEAARDGVHGRMMNLKGLLDNKVDAAKPKPDALTGAVLELTGLIKRQQFRSDLEKIKADERMGIFTKARESGDIETVLAFDGLIPLLPRNVLDNAKLECEYLRTYRIAKDELNNFESALQARDSFQSTLEIARRKAQKLLSDAGIHATDLGDIEGMTTKQKTDFISTNGLGAFKKLVNPLA